jgi:Zn-dependent protease
MDGHFIVGLIIWYVVFVFSTTCHEAAHAWVAYLGGDSTAYEGGQVTLDPGPHIKRSPLGMVVIPLLSFFMSGGGYMFGFASAPFDPLWAQRNPSKYARMSLAGPLANFTLALVAVGLMYWGVHAGVFQPGYGRSLDQVIVGVGMWGAAAMTLSVLLFLNILLGLFNLLPIPPLDGASVLEGAFPDSVGHFYQRLRSYPMAGLIGFLVILNFGGRLIARPMGWLLNTALAVVFS